MKHIRTVVMIISVVVSLAFSLNSANGILGAINLADGNMKTEDILPGDFKINYDNLSIDVGVVINNDGTYDIENIIVGVLFEIKSNISDVWVPILDTDTVKLGDASKEGDNVAAGENKTIGIKAEIGDFLMDTATIASTFGLTASWTLQDLMNTQFEAKLTLNFKVSYAFGQFELDSTITLNNDAVKQGLGA